LGHCSSWLDRLSEQEKIKILKDTLGSYFFEGQNQLMFHCPKCEHRKKKLSVNVSKNMFKCWVCNFSGRNIFRIIKTYGTNLNKKNWLKLTQQVEIQDFSKKLFEKEKQEVNNVTLPKEFISLANKNLPPTSLYALNYLRFRGITKSDIIKWKIGYCSTGKYEGRVIFPSFNLDGTLNYFVARTYNRDWRRYLNPSLSSDMIFNHLYLDFLKPITIVEGVFDAVKAGDNSVPLLGSTLSEKSYLLSEIVRNDTTVCLALDSDADKKISELLSLFLKYDIEAYKIDLKKTKYEDIGEMSKEEFKKLKSTMQKINFDNLLVNKIMNI